MSCQTPCSNATTLPPCIVTPSLLLPLLLIMLLLPIVSPTKKEGKSTVIFPRVALP